MKKCLYVFKTYINTFTYIYIHLYYIQHIWYIIITLHTLHEVLHYWVYAILYRLYTLYILRLHMCTRIPDKKYGLPEMFGFLMTQRYMYIYSSQTCPHSNGNYWWRDSLSTEPWWMEEEFHIFPVETQSYTSNSSRRIFSIMSCVISQLAMFVHQEFCHS